MDPAFASAGKNAGVMAWRIENMAPVPVDFNGKLYSGDSYIFLHSHNKGTSCALAHDIFFWLGKDTSQDESGTAAIKTVELDEALGGSPVQYREVEGHETPQFLALFKKVGGLEYLDGGVASGFKTVDRDHYDTRLLMVKGNRTVRVTEVPVTNASLNTNDVFILDMGMSLFLYFGAEANKAERSKGIDFINKLRNNERGGKATITLLADEPDNKDFWDNLGGFMAVVNPGESDHAADAKESKLFHITDSSGDMTFDAVPLEGGHLKKSLLLSNDVFLVDNLSEIFLWVGKEASANERKSGLTYAMQYLASNNYPQHTSVQKVTEGAESAKFISNFHVWNPPQKFEFGQTYSTSVAKTQQDEAVDVSALLNTTPAEDIGFPSGGQITIWRIENFEKVEFDKDLYGQFWGGDSYIILYTYKANEVEGHAIFFWLGDTSTKDETGAAALLTQELDDSMGGSPVQVRVTQGKEPAFFRQLFNGRMVVHTGGVAAGWKNKIDTDTFDEDGIALYRIRGNHADNTICQQIPEEAEQLNSNDSFVLCNYLEHKIYIWQGNHASPEEKQAGFNCADMLSYAGVETIELTEGEEPEEFWLAVGGKAEYGRIEHGSLAPRDPRLFQCSNASGSFKVEEVFYFEQEDLNDEDVMLLDCYTTVFLWIGSQAHSDEKAKAQSFAEQFVEQAHDGREAQTTPILRINAGAEPKMFTTQFVVWDPEFTSKNKYLDPYEVKIAALAKEKAEREAKIFGDSSAPVEVKAPAPIVAASAGGTFSYEDLKNNNFAAGAIDVTSKEIYLADAEFASVFAMDKATFSGLAKWKRDAAKKKVGLF